eukprot:COSAG02_NODE_1691_length_11296_cov_7.891757_8_plen_121_part_00
MHIKRSELSPAAGASGESILTYPAAEGQDCQSLERFRIRTLAPNAATATETDPERESFWMVIRGSGTVHRGDKSAPLGEKDLLIFAGGEPHSFEAGNCPSLSPSLQTSRFSLPSPAIEWT